MSVRKQSNGKWKAEVWFKNQRICSKTFSNKALAEKFERTKIQELEFSLLTGVQARDYSYGEIFQFWYSDASVRKRSTSLVKDQQMNRDFVVPVIGNLKISEINHLHFQRVIDEMLSRGLTKSSVNKVIQHFKAVFNHSFTHELIARNPARNVKQFKLPKKEMDYLSKEELNTFLTYTNQKYQGEERWKHALYLTFFVTGARLGEVLALQWNQVHFAEDIILINQIWCSKEHKLINSTKGNKDVRLPLNSLLKKELASLKNLRRFKNGDFIYSDNGERPLDANNFRTRMWTQDLEEAGVKKIRIHDSRHTYASHFMMENGNLYDLKMLLNHSSISVTEKYAKMSPSHLMRLKDKVMPNIGLADNVLAVDSFSKKDEPRQIPAWEIQESKFKM